MRRLLITLPLLLVTACGGHETDQPTVSSAEDVATLVGCNDFKPDDNAEMYVAETGSCHLSDEFVVVNYFDSPDKVSQYRDAAGSVGTRMLYGDRWAVYADSADTLKAAQVKAGGTIE